MSQIDTTIVQVGEFSVNLPKGWLAVPVGNSFSGDTKAVRKDMVRLCKGGESPYDILTKPMVEIVFYGKKQGIMPPKTAYKNVSDLPPFTTGQHTWTGFSGCSMLGKELILLWEDTGALQYQVAIWPSAQGETIALQDGDVTTILESIVPS